MPAEKSKSFAIIESVLANSDLSFTDTLFLTSVMAVKGYDRDATVNLLTKVSKDIASQDASNSKKAEYCYQVAVNYYTLNELNKSLEYINKAIVLQPDDIFILKGKKYYIYSGLHNSYERLKTKILKEIKRKKQEGQTLSRELINIQRSNSFEKCFNARPQHKRL